MQTFLPSSNAITTAKWLDNKRLNKQILECYQILNVLSGKSKTGGWRNHPAVLMWKGYERGLWQYVQAMVREARQRGIRTENNESNLNRLKDMCWDTWGSNPPEFWSDTNKLMRITTTHKANLFDKDPIFYAKFGYAKHSLYNQPCCSTCKYYWVTHDKKLDF
jgi:Pyrimidine dimer DNA glycosylase